MLQSDGGAADVGPADPAPSDTSRRRASGSRDAAGSSSAGSDRRRRHGRQRGSIPAGETFVARLGPVNGEPFASLHDPQDSAVPDSPSPDMPLEVLTFVALDCETTGQSPHRLVELGAVAFTLNGHVASLETLVHNTDRINPYARRVHGISTAILAGAPPPSAVLERFRRFAEGAVLVEHSADAFDTRLIARTLGEPLANPNIDTSRLAAKLWDLRDTIGLERLCAELGISHRRPHHALADAEATAACFLALLERGRERFGWQTLGDLLVDGQPPQPRPVTALGQRRRRSPLDPPPSDGATAAPKKRRRRGGRRRRRSTSVDGTGSTAEPT